jgi:hypothetical protein
VKDENTRKEISLLMRQKIDNIPISKSNPFFISVSLQKDCGALLHIGDLLERRNLSFSGFARHSRLEEENAEGMYLYALGHSARWLCTTALGSSIGDVHRECGCYLCGYVWLWVLWFCEVRRISQTRGGYTPGVGHLTSRTLL